MIAGESWAFDVGNVVLELHLDVFDHTVGAKGVDASVAVSEFLVGECYGFYANLAGEC